MNWYSEENSITDSIHTDCALWFQLWSKFLYVRRVKGEDVLKTIEAPPDSTLDARMQHYGLLESSGYEWQTFQSCHNLEF